MGKTSLFRGKKGEVQSISGTTAKRRYMIMWENGRESEVTNNAICLPEDLRLLERKKRKRKKNGPPRTAQIDEEVSSEESESSIDSSDTPHSGSDEENEEDDQPR